MKRLRLIGVSVMALLICATLRSQPQNKGRQEQSGSGAQDKTLFLHLLADRAYTDPPIPAHRIVTARVYPFQDFSVSVGDQDDPFKKPWDGAYTNPVWRENRPPEARPLEPLWNSGDAALAGRVEQVNGKFIAHLQGRDGTTLNYFNGEIELEKPVYEQGGYYHGGSVCGVWFALSTNDCSRFIRALEDGSLSRPNVVDRNSPLVDPWVRGQPGAKPDGAPKGGPAPSSANSEPQEVHHR